MRISKPILEIEGENKGKGQIEHAMAADIPEIKAINLLSLDKAKQWPDWPKWLLAIWEELDNLRKARTWTIVERPKGKNIVRNKWIFRYKTDSAGKVERYKVRLVTKGFTQTFGVDYYEMWPPVAKFRLIWLILVTATQNQWLIDMLSFHSAFLNGELDSDEELYMEQPEGYKEQDRKWYVCRLLKSLYVLKQAGRKWYNALCKVLIKISFKQSEADPTIFYAHKINDITVLTCHVNNCTITGSSQVVIQGYKDKLK